MVLRSFGRSAVTDRQARILEAVEAGGAVDRTAARKACGIGKTRAADTVRDVDAPVRAGFLVTDSKRVGPPTGRVSKTVTVWGRPHEFAAVTVPFSATPEAEPADRRATRPSPAAGLGAVSAFVRNELRTEIVPLEGAGAGCPPIPTTPPRTGPLRGNAGGRLTGPTAGAAPPGTVSRFASQPRPSHAHGRLSLQKQYAPQDSNLQPPVP